MNGYPYPRNGPMMMDMTGDAITASQSNNNAPYQQYDNGFDLDSIVAQNDKDNRRRSMPVYARGQPQPQMNLSSPEARRLSMMNFGRPNGGNMDDFQFDMSTAAMDNMMHSNTTFPRTTGDMQNTQLPATDLSINTQFQGQNSPYSTMAAPGSAYASPMHQKGSMDMDMASYQNGMTMPLDMDDSLNMMPTDMNLFPGSQFNDPMLDSPINQDFVGPMPAATPDTNQNNTPRPSQAGPASSAAQEARIPATCDPTLGLRASITRQLVFQHA
jgi:hypothetical protein